MSKKLLLAALASLGVCTAYGAENASTADAQLQPTYATVTAPGMSGTQAIIGTGGKSKAIIGTGGKAK